MIFLILAAIFIALKSSQPLRFKCRRVRRSYYHPVCSPTEPPVLFNQINIVTLLSRSHVVRDENENVLIGQRSYGEIILEKSQQISTDEHLKVDHEQNIIRKMSSAETLNVADEVITTAGSLRLVLNRSNRL